MKTRKTYTHSDSFWLKRYNDVKAFTQKKGITFPFKSVREFISDYRAIKADGVKNVMKEIKYSLQYQTSYKTALAEKRALKEANVQAPSFKELKTISTQEFAEKYKDELITNYHSLKAQGMSSVNAREFISNYWFGSK